MSVSETLHFVRAQKAVELFPDGGSAEYDVQKLGLMSYVAWRYEGYHRTLRMFLRSLEISQKPKILELGALPYIFTSLILRTNREMDLYVGGAPSNNPGRTHGEVKIENQFLKRKYCILPLSLFNVEKDVFPYPDKTFDVVLCCEILEHLPFSPSHMLHEINRVLKKKGELILTTPNILGIGKVLQILRGRNIYAPLSRATIYGRHNREYTPDEVSKLLCLSNFKVVETVFANPRMPRDAYAKGCLGWVKYVIIKSLYKFVQNSFLKPRGDFLLFRAQKIGPPNYAEPDFLYGDVAGTRRN